MILAGPFGPKFIAEACVASEKVGEGGPGEALRLMEPKEKVRRRLGAMVVKDSEPTMYSTDVMLYFNLR
jgi:hypothetical protein